MVEPIAAFRCVSRSPLNEPESASRGASHPVLDDPGKGRASLIREGLSAVLQPPRVRRVPRAPEGAAMAGGARVVHRPPGRDSGGT